MMTYSNDIFSIFIVHPDGTLEKKLLGADPDRGCQLQLLVKGDCWKGCVLPEGAFSLIGEVVAPGSEYRDNVIADPEGFKALFPELWQELSPYVLDARE